jgi:hypothetical protein
MTTTKTLLLAGFAALSLGVGAAMAQESPGDGYVSPYQMQQLPASRAVPAAMQAGHAAATPASDLPVQYGSSDHASVNDWQVLQGGDGVGG